LKRGWLEPFFCFWTPPNGRASWLHDSGGALSAKVRKLEEMLAPVVEGLGFVFWGIEYLAQGKHSTVRVYIDHSDGVTVDDCEQVSRQVSGVLDVEDPIGTHYTLEVSSPGMDRPLFRLDQYHDFIGSRLSVRLSAPFEGRRKYEGILRAVEGEDICLVVGEYELQLPFESIESARIVPVFE